MVDSHYILDELTLMYPDARCELNHKNPYELTIAVTLSAQTTDVAVNKITPKLFEKFPDPYTLANADVEEIEKYIKSIGLYRNKARNIKELAQGLIDLYEGEVPATREKLMILRGVGRKSANVILSVCFNVPAIAVDTHVERVSKRLTLAKKNDDVLTVEKKLMKKIAKERWNLAHHLFIFFGRYKCTARNPKCEFCPFSDFCSYQKEIKKVKK